MLKVVVSDLRYLFVGSCKEFVRSLIESCELGDVSCKENVRRNVRYLIELRAVRSLLEILRYSIELRAVRVC